MAGLILVTGGARSGKSDFAAKLASRLAKGTAEGGSRRKIRQVIYLATGQALDEEMERRIVQHKRQRPKTWQTIEEPLEVEQAISRKVRNKQALIIFDCLTLFLSNLLSAGIGQRGILARIKELAVFLAGLDNQVIIVTNEVGSGIVPENKLARDFRDLQGRANCIMANQAEEVYLLVCGQALKIK